MARIVSATPSTLVSIIAFQCSTDSSRKPRLAPKPALANTASMRPNLSSVASVRPSTSAQSVTSQGRAIARSRPPSSRASLSSCAFRLAPSASRKPASAALRAVAAPIPLLAPVISRTGSSAMRGILALR